jgi:hypothetical protein
MQACEAAVLGEKHGDHVAGGVGRNRHGNHLLGGDGRAFAALMHQPRTFDDPPYKVSVDQADKTVNFDGGEYVLTNADSTFIAFEGHDDTGNIDRITGQLSMSRFDYMRRVRFSLRLQRSKVATSLF